MAYQQILKQAMESRTPSQLDKSKEIYARVQRYRQQNESFRKAGDIGKTKLMKYILGN